jgi:tetratricopeptide (TPR) repeat protein
MSFDEDVDRDVGREEDRSRDIVRSADEQKRALSELNAIAKEHAQVIELVSMNFQSLYNAMNLFASALMTVVVTFMKSTGASKEQIEALDNLARQYLVMQQILKATNTSVEKYMKITAELQKSIKKQMDVLRGEKKEFEELMKSARAWSQIYSSAIKLVESATDVMYGFSRQQLAVIGAQIDIYRAQMQYNQALAMYNAIVERYGENSEEARRAEEALRYAKLNLNVASQQLIITEAKLYLVWLDLIGNISISIIAIRIAAGMIKGLLGSFAGLAGAIGLVLVAFGAAGIAAEKLLGGYEGIKKRNKEIIESSSGLARGMAEFGDQVVVFAQNLPPLLKEVVEGFGIVTLGWAKIFDTAGDIIGQGLSWIQQRISEGVTTFSQSIGGIYDAITKTVGGAVTAATTTFSTWFGNISKGVEVVMSLFTNFGNVINALVGVFTNFGNTVMGVLKPITDTIGGLGNAVKNIPVLGALFGGGRQVGGEIERGGLYYLHPGEMVTRRGFEGNRVTNVSPNINVNMTFNVSSEVDVSRVREEVQRAVSEAIQKGLYVRGVLAGP